MDNERKEGTAYEYLCHLEEAKKWIEECIKEELPSSTVLEENFRNGVYFAKLGHFCAPNVVPKRKIFDPEHKKWETSGLHFKHTDNINFFLAALRETGLPEVKITVEVIGLKTNILRLDFPARDHRYLRQEEHAASCVLYPRLVSLHVQDGLSSSDPGPLWSLGVHLGRDQLHGGGAQQDRGGDAAIQAAGWSPG